MFLQNLIRRYLSSIRECYFLTKILNELNFSKYPAISLSRCITNYPLCKIFVNKPPNAIFSVKRRGARVMSRHLISIYNVYTSYMCVSEETSFDKPLGFLRTPYHEPYREPFVCR